MLDLGVVTPALLLAGAQVLRRMPAGYLLSFALLGIIVILGPAIAAQTVSQLSAGVSFTVAEVVGPIAGFGVLAVVAVWILARLLLLGIRARAEAARRQREPTTGGAGPRRGRR